MMGSMKDTLGDTPFHARTYRNTSRWAWEAHLPRAGELDKQIMSAIFMAEPMGITCEEIEKKIGRPHQAVSGNLRHLVEKGFARASDRFGITQSGRRAIKWVAVKAMEVA